MSAHKLVKVFGLLLILIAGSAVLRAGEARPMKPGQSVTVLPDGRTLLLGGFESAGRPSAKAEFADASGVVESLSANLQVQNRAPALSRQANFCIQPVISTRRGAPG